MLLDEQWHVVDHYGVLGGVADELTRTRRDAGVGDLLEVAASLRVGEDERAQRSPVEGAVLLENAVAETAGNGGQPLRAWRDDLPGQAVRVDDHRAECRKPLRYSRFARPDSSERPMRNMQPL